jgi:hypothetical protein
MAKQLICVTIVKDRTMPGGGYLLSKEYIDGARRGRINAGRSPEEAAASAINHASTMRGKIRCYCPIVAPPEVMACIPAMVKARIRKI